MPTTGASSTSAPCDLTSEQGHPASFWPACRGEDGWPWSLRRVLPAGGRSGQANIGSAVRGRQSADRSEPGPGRPGRRGTDPQGCEELVVRRSWRSGQAQCREPDRAGRTAAEGRTSAAGCWPAGGGRAEHVLTDRPDEHGLQPGLRLLLPEHRPGSHRRRPPAEDRPRQADLADHHYDPVVHRTPDERGRAQEAQDSPVRRGTAAESPRLRRSSWPGRPSTARPRPG